MRKYKSLVFHIIGAKTEVCIASNEIYQYAIDHYFTTKIIQKNNLSRELYQQANQNVYIHECNQLECEEIKNIHNSLYHRYYRSPIFSYTIYVNQPPFFCPYIDMVYRLDDKKNEKCKILHPLLFTNQDSKYSFRR